jgi:hypothetical protein
MTTVNHLVAKEGQTAARLTKRNGRASAAILEL